MKPTAFGSLELLFHFALSKILAVNFAPFMREISFVQCDCYADYNTRDSSADNEANDRFGVFFYILLP